MSFYQRIFRFTNLDICFGAVINCAFVSNVLEIELGWEVYVVLFAAVWIIYTLDRIVDTMNTKSKMLPRHEFHWKYRRVLLVIAVFFAGVCVFLLPKINPVIILNGFVLSVLVLVYLLAAWRRSRIPKEALIALLYSTGVFLAPVSLLSGSNPDVYFLLAQHVMLAQANLILISWHEREADLANGHSNITLSLSFPPKTFIFLLLAVCIIVAVWAFPHYGYRPQVIFGLMWVVFLVIMMFPEWFSKNDRYGIAADSAFFIPLLIYIFP